jgi:hypothetical protein
MLEMTGAVLSVTAKVLVPQSTNPLPSARSVACTLREVRSTGLASVVIEIGKFSDCPTPILPSVKVKRDSSDRALVQPSFDAPVIE